MNELSTIREDPLTEKLHPDIYVEPKDRDPMDEDHRQMAVVSGVRRDYPYIAVHATPNGGKQSDWARIRGAKMGVYTGWPDLGFDWTADGAEIEMKDGQGNPSQSQIQCLNRLHRMGKKVAICRTKAGVFGRLRLWGALP